MHSREYSNSMGNSCGVRTKEDKELDKVFDNHYRRYIDTDLLITKLINLGFSIQEFSKEWIYDYPNK